ncbi:MAG TPA: hypothetical protein VFR15_06415, partial [Chloroflexia bacterium]|nr:hypothetical protein [Chloroflexia bacterium]
MTNSPDDQKSSDYTEEAKAGPEPSPPLPQVLIWRVLPLLLLAIIIGGAVQFLRPLPLYAAMSVAWVGIMIATLIILWWLHAISIEGLVLFGLGWASLILLVYAEMRKEERDASGIEN